MIGKIDIDGKQFHERIMMSNSIKWVGIRNLKTIGFWRILKSDRI